MIRNIVKTWLVILLLSPALPSYALDLAQHPKVKVVVDELVAEQIYSESELVEIFAGAKVQQSVLNAMKNPAEYKFTWGKYRKLFLQADRIQKGVAFWQQYESELTRAEKEYGVPAHVIVAIIGVESKYGKYRGKHKVLDSLVSLVTDFPRRSDFFAKELKHFLKLTKENQLNANDILGSYAGAVGYPQFISSSYRAYAVDFSGDGKTDLIDQPVDAIGSVANYFVKNGWLTGQPVTSAPINNVSAELKALANRKRKVKFTAASLREKGAVLNPAIPGEEKLNVLEMNASEIVPEPSNSNYYIVRAGDTACQIAERFSMPCKQLFRLNKLNDRGSIYRGQKLNVIAKAIPQNSNGDSKWVVNKESSTNGEPSAELMVPTEQPRFFFTHENFYVITRYNHSVLYAMAVHDLSQAINQAKRAPTQLGAINND